MIPMDASRSADGSFASLKVPSRVESVRVAAAFFVQAAKDMRVPLASDSLFELAVVEALNNAVKHGNADRNAAAVILCELEFVNPRLTVRILDQGPGFEMPRASIPEPTPDDILSVPDSGRGISIIQHVFATVRTISRDSRFGVEMSLTLPQ